MGDGPGVAGRAQRRGAELLLWAPAVPSLLVDRRGSRLRTVAAVAGRVRASGEKGLLARCVNRGVAGRAARGSVGPERGRWSAC